MKHVLLSLLLGGGRVAVIFMQCCRQGCLRLAAMSGNSAVGDNEGAGAIIIFGDTAMMFAIISGLIFVSLSSLGKRLENVAKSGE